MKSKSATGDGEDGEEGEGLKLLVPAVLAVKTRKAYLHTFAAHLRRKEEDEAKGRGSKRGRDGKAKKGKSSKAAEGMDKEDSVEAWSMDATYELPPSEATVQGSLLLQSLLRLPGPPAPPRAPAKRTFGRPAPAAPTAAPESYGSALVLDSLLALPTLSPFARNPVSVHILISSLTPHPSPPAGLDYSQSSRRRKLSTLLTNSLPTYCGDKYGSRLADALWFSVDGFTKEKIVKTVVEHDAEVLKGQYGVLYGQVAAAVV